MAAEIREHFAQGRLNAEELDERLSLAYAARTRADLEELRHDLPRLPASPALRRAEVAQRRAELSRHLLQQTGGALVPFGVCTAIWLASGANGSFWPVWVILIALIPLLRNGLAALRARSDLEGVERSLTASTGGGGAFRRAPKASRGELNILASGYLSSIVHQ